jgi:hypothetical protein
VSRVSEIRSEVGHASDHAEVPVPQFPLSLRIGFWACIVIAVAVVIRRLFALLHPSHSAPAQLAALDGWFASHATLTFAHIVPALLFVVITPFFVFRKSKNNELGGLRAACVRHSGCNHSLCHERVCCRWVGGTLSGPNV